MVAPEVFGVMFLAGFVLLIIDLLSVGRENNEAAVKKPAADTA